MYCSLNALGRRRRCIFHFPIAESKRRGRQGGNTFLLCCLLYGSQEYPSFYCTLIYYNETGDKAGRASVWCLHRSARCQTVSSVAGLRRPSGDTPPQTRAAFDYFKQVSCFHLHPHLCPCCVMSMALLAGTGEPPSVTLSTSMDFLSGLLLP